MRPGAGDVVEAVAEMLRWHAAMSMSASRQAERAAHFVAGHPGTPVAEVPLASEDVHDIEGLRSIGAQLAG